MAKTSYSLSHTKWMCKYHIVFTPKYRRKAIYYKVRSDLIDIIKYLCGCRGVEIIEGHMMYATGLIQPFIGCGEEMSDLISESHLALTMAVAEYKSGDLKAQIRTAVEKRLNEIVDEETKVKNASNMLAERLNDLMEASRILAQELSDRLMVPKDEVEELLKISLNAMDPEKNI